MRKIFFAITILVFVLLLSVFCFDKYQDYHKKKSIIYTQKYLEKNIQNWEDDECKEYNLATLNKAIYLFNQNKIIDSYNLISNYKTKDIFIKNMKTILLVNIYLTDNKICDKKYIVNMVQEMDYKQTKVILLNLLQDDKILEDNTILHKLLNNRGNMNVVK